MPDTDHIQIYERLGKIEANQAGDHVWRAQVSESLRRILEALDGNSHPGIKTRLDRLEQAGRLVKWFAVTVFGSIIILAIRSFWSLL